MQTVTYKAPALFGDHHVIEAHRLLSKLEGVKDIYASSAFQTIEVMFDPEVIDEQAIASVLEETGYLSELVMPVEAGASAYLQDQTQAYFRHTEVFETSKEVVSFAQNVSYSGRPLWYCPGIGVIKDKTEE